MSEWLQENEVLLTVIVLAVSVGGLLFVPWLVARIPADYFATHAERASAAGGAAAAAADYAAIDAANATTCAAAKAATWQQFNPCGLLQRLIEV